MQSVPPAVIEALEADLPALEARVLDVLRAEVPIFARPLEGGYGRDVRETTRALLADFVARLSDSERDQAAELDRTRDYGRREARLGRQLDGLLAAYRVASRVYWREVSELSARLELDRETLTALGEIVFAFFDELSVAAAQGFAEEQARAAGERARRDERLLGLLLREPPTDPATLAAAVEAAGWRPPPRLAAVAVDDDALGPEVAGRLAAGTLAARRGQLLCLVVPTVPDPISGLRAVLGSCRATLGPDVEWTRAAHSFRRAALALEHLEPSEALIVTDERLLDLLIDGAPDLIDDLAEQTLAPLNAIRPAPRARLLLTLRAWLDHQGHQGATAFALGIHQQTVRYRLAQLRDLLGPVMDDADGRLAIQLVLRGHRR
jgi:hypothetical protein